MYLAKRKSIWGIAQTAIYGKSKFKLCSETPGSKQRSIKSNCKISV